MNRAVQSPLTVSCLGERLIQFLDHLRYERNVSAHTLRNYESDLQQFIDYLVPPQTAESALTNGKERSPNRKAVEPDIKQIDHITIREWLASLHSDHKKKSSI